MVVDGTDCNVSSSASVARLTAYAKSKLGRIDVWINNAGYSGSFQVLAALQYLTALGTALVLKAMLSHGLLVLLTTTTPPDSKWFGCCQ